MIKRISIVGVFLVLLLGCGSKDPEIVKPVEPEIVLETSLNVSLKGEKYVLPAPYQDFVANGWVPEQDIDQVMPPKTKMSNMYLRNNDNIIKVTFSNNSDQEVIMSDAKIAEIYAENRTFGGDVSVDIVVNDFLTFETPLSDVETRFGVSELKSNEVFDEYTFILSPVEKLVISYHKDGSDGNQSRWIGVIDYK
ncbi:hypothetical protein [Erysipelothrix aquatica]|uniref:hypothetical protein n=1 Tax=Erysipelothrix aquatica TaxID=2683714 RepID=UPI00135BA57B|nr:hypothetical protein [Erysipelothrix aquatica]